MNTDAQLIEAFVASFSRSDECIVYTRDVDPVGWELRTGEIVAGGGHRWQARRVLTHPSALNEVYAKLPAPLPPLYQQLILTYRYAEVDLGRMRLLANPPGSDLIGLLGEMFKDEALIQTLIPKGYIPFGKGPGLNYDPVCFDLRHRTKDGDYRIVRLDHEAILCDEHLQVVGELATSFCALVLQVVGTLEQK